MHSLARHSEENVAVTLLCMGVFILCRNGTRPADTTLDL
jgi:hypothetical protein